MQPIKKVMIIAGEASGDLHGSNLVSELKQLSPDIEFVGMGGKRMRESGVELIVDIADLSVCGFIEILGYLPKYIKIFSTIKQALKDHQPDLLILIDFPTFNLRLAKSAHQLNLKTLYYISPQLWAWHTSRVKKIKEYVAMMAVIIPFEAKFYRDYDVPVKYVGHPTVELFEQQSLLSSAIVNQSTPPVIGLFPGSRKNEIKYVLPILLKSAELIKRNIPNATFMLPLASTVNEEEIASQLTQTHCPITLVTHDHYQAMQRCDLAIATSGTVTLELALIGVPILIVYKVHPITYQLGKWVVKIPYIGLCNVIAEKFIVTELLQHNATPEKINQEAIKLLKDESSRKIQRTEFAALYQKLSVNKESTVAELALDLIQN